MVVHGDVAFAQPCAGTCCEWHPLLVQSHQPPAAGRMGRERDFLDGIEPAGAAAMCHEHKLVRLPDCLSGPVAGSVVRKIDDELVFALDRIQPVHDRRVAELEMGKALLDVCLGKEQTFSQRRKGGLEAVKESRRNTAVSGRDDGYASVRPRRDRCR